MFATRLLRLTILAAIVAIVAAALAAVAASPAAAHEIEMVRSTPAAGAVLERSPRRVVIMFSGEPDAGRSSIAVADAEGKRVKRVSAAREVPGDTLKLQAIVRASLSSGRYTVKRKAVTLDGHASTGSFTFHVKLAPDTGPSVGPPVAASASAAANAATTASASPAAASVDGGRGVWIIVVNLALLIGVVVAAVVFLRRRSARARR